MNNREAFEAWFGSEMPMESLITNQDNDYKYQPAIASWESWQAALASQKDHIPDVGKMVEVSEHGEVQENDCPECGAEAGSSCSSDEGIEYGRRVHEARQSQVQQPTDLSKQLREYAGDSGYSHNDYADTMLAAASEIERCAARFVPSQAPQTESQWISVEDRLPEMETPVVALVGKNVYALARVDYDEGWLWAICGCDLSDIRDYEADDDYQPTYWMPLAIPPAPEGDKP